MSLGEFMWENRLEIAKQLIEHVQLTLISLFSACFIGLLLGIWISKTKVVRRPVLAFINTLQTIPSIALLGFLIPIAGIGMLPAIIALFLYALLPIVRNAYTGIAEVKSSVVEAARAMGMKPLQVLIKVELPLALATLFAGIRTASVINVGVATLSAFIGAGGLGEYIFRGIQLNNTQMILAGAIPASLLAILFDQGLGFIQKRLNARRTKTVFSLGILSLGLLLLSFYQKPSNQHLLMGGFPNEFIHREDGLLGLKEHYQLEFNHLELDPGLMYMALQAGKVDLISGFSTDGRIKAYDLKLLEDDLNYFPAYEAAPLFRDETMQQFPELEGILEKLASLLDEAEMAELNYQADELGFMPKRIAWNFLEEKGFPLPENSNAPVKLTLGSKAFTENYILAYLLKYAIEGQSRLGVDLKLGFGGTKLLMEALLQGQIDGYPEYTGTALLLLLKPDSKAKESLYQSPEAMDAYVRQKSLDSLGLFWGPSFGFNNTFALMMRRKQADSLGIQKISDLRSF